jgi:hypothetical protein
MTNEELKELGLNDEQCATVFKLRGKAIETAEAEAEALKAARATIKERDKQLEGLRAASGDAETMKQTIEQLQKDNKEKDEKHTKAMQQLRVNAAVERALTAAGAKNATMAKAVLAEFLGTAELDGDTVKGLEDKIKELVSGSDTGFLFDAIDPATVAFQVSGAAPAGTPKKPLSEKGSEFTSRLADAKKTNNLAAVMQVRREAAEQGIILN